MSTFIGSGSSSPHSLRSRWTPLHTHFTGRCVDEHNQLISSFQRAVADAPNATLSSNAKLRGLVDTMSARGDAIENFILKHRTTYGDVDSRQLVAFEELLERLDAAKSRALAWDRANRSPRAVCPKTRKTITFMSPIKPNTSLQSINTNSASSIMRPEPARPTMQELTLSFEELAKSGPPTFRQPCFGRRSRSAPLKVAVSSPAHLSDYDATQVEPHGHLPRPPVGYLLDFSVEAEELKQRLAVQHDEFLSFDHICFRHQHCRPRVVAPAAPFQEGPLVSDIMLSVLPWKLQGLKRGQIAQLLCVFFVLAVGVYLVAVLLQEIDDLLDSLRPYGRGWNH